MNENIWLVIKLIIGKRLGEVVFKLYVILFFILRTLGAIDINFVNAQKIKGTDPAQRNRPWALHWYERPMAHGNALTKEAGELSKMGPKPNNERKKRKGLENKVQTTL